MTDLLALSFSVAGFTALALSMYRHHRDVLGVPPLRGRSILLLLVGSSLLGLSFAVCIAGSGWSIGPVLLFGILSVAGFIVVLLLAYRLHVITLAVSIVFLLVIGTSDYACADAVVADQDIAAVASLMRGEDVLPTTDQHTLKSAAN